MRHVPLCVSVPHVCIGDPSEQLLLLDKLVLLLIRGNSRLVLDHLFRLFAILAFLIDLLFKDGPVAGVPGFQRLQEQVLILFLLGELHLLRLLLLVDGPV